MSRDATAAARAELYASESPEVWVTLLIIEHASLADPIRLCNNNEDVVSNGETFVALGFPPILPTETEGELPAIEMTLDNVGRELTTALRAITSPITVTEYVVRASDPDELQAGPLVYESRVIRYLDTNVRIELGSESLMTEPFVGDVYTRTTNPGLFEGVAP